ncbi:MAG: hypothetical protein Q9197_005924 [Variospora fuerteventurae]
MTDDVSTRQRFEIERIPSRDLAAASKLESIWNFANDVFADRQRNFPDLGFEEGKRFERPQDFQDEMGPSAVTFIQYGRDLRKPNGEAEIIATAGCKPWNIAFKLDERVERMREERRAREREATKSQGESNDGFYTKAHEDQLLESLEKTGPMTHSDGQDDVPRWEVMTVCVHPDWQKQGLAEKLLEVVREEVSSQVKAQGKGPEFKLMVRTLKEINEKYWLSKGFKTVGEKFFEPGLFGSPTGFHIIDLSRDHRVD